MPLIRAAGRRVHIQELGKGPTVVLVHPMTFNLAVWYFTVAPLLARSLRVVLYDLRGHGRSGHAPDGYDLPTLAGDLRDLLETLEGPDGGPVHVGGYSSGATLALRFAADHPAWVRSLAVLDAPMPPFPVRERARDQGVDPEAVLDDFPREEVEVTRGSRRKALRTNRHVRLRTRTTFTDDFESEPAFDEELRGVDRPVLLLYGDHSPFLDVGRRLAGILPDAELQIVPGSHRIPLEQRDLVGQRMRAFLS